MPMAEHLAMAMKIHFGLGGAALLLSGGVAAWRGRLKFSLAAIILLVLLVAGAIAPCVFLEDEALRRFLAPVALWLAIGVLWLQLARAAERISVPAVMGGALLGAGVGTLVSWYVLLSVAVVRYMIK